MPFCPLAELELSILAVEAVTDYLSSRVQVGEVFSIEDVLRVRGSTGDELPSYQVYLTLAWLRELSEPSE